MDDQYARQVIPLAALRREALAVGFADVGAARAARLDGAMRRRREWIASGGHAEMLYLARNAALRGDPRRLQPGTRTVISLITGYPRCEGEVLPGVRVASYARGEDYHTAMRARAEALIARLEAQWGPMQGRVVIDSAPFMDVEWATRAGLGWRGRHALLVHPELGTYHHLAAILTPRLVEVTGRVLPPRCGRCQRCVEACPTGALRGDGSLAGGRCRAYLTIERRGVATPEEEELMGDALFGCDLCQEACPWNRHIERVTSWGFLDGEWLRSFARGEVGIPKDSALRRASVGRLRERLRHLLGEG